MTCRQTAECQRCHPVWGSCHLLAGHRGDHFTVGAHGRKTPPTKEQGPICTQVGPCYCDEDD